MSAAPRGFRFLRFKWMKKGSGYPYGQSGFAHLRYFDKQGKAFPPENAVQPHLNQPVPDAPHWHVTAQHPAYGLPSRAFNGDMTSYTAQHPPFPLWVCLDIGAEATPVELSGVELGAFETNETDMPRDFVVEGTNDPAAAKAGQQTHLDEAWTNLFSATDVKFQAKEVKKWVFQEKPDATE
jgi:hypothetical protein